MSNSSEQNQSHTRVPQEQSQGFRWLAFLTLAIWLAGLIASLAGIPSVGTPGWDESGHAYSALRMGVALRDFDLGAFFTEFHRPDFYTGPGRIGMVPAFLFSDSFMAARVITGIAWFLVIALGGLLAREVVGHEGLGKRAKDTAMFWAVFFGVSCGLGIAYSRTAYQEAWAGLYLLAALFCYLRARRPLESENEDEERRQEKWMWVCGVIVGLALIAKLTYGLFLVATIGTSGLWDLIARPKGVQAKALALRISAGALLVALWWFVLPLPFGWPTGREHWDFMVEYLLKAKDLSTHGPGLLWIAWGLQASLSLIAYALQLAGWAYGAKHWQNPVARICLLAPLFAAIGFYSYDFRIDRFLLPTAFGTWALAGALLAWLSLRLPSAGRLFAGAVLLAAIVFTRGMGRVELMARALPASTPAEEWNETRRAAAHAGSKDWFDPYLRGKRGGDATGPPGTQLVLDAAAKHFDATQGFGWIGGTGTELSLFLLQWQLFQKSGERSLLYREPDKIDHFWSDPGWDENEFQAWALGHSQVGVLDPPDPRNRPRPVEVRFAQWMSQHPGFEHYASEAIEIEARKDQPQPFQVHFYRRR